jgi:hypothetical protein
MYTSTKKDKKKKVLTEFHGGWNRWRRRRDYGKRMNEYNYQNVVNEMK